MNRDELSVYADKLQIEGDIRGEIIALELLAEETGRSDLAARHRELVQAWLGGDAHAWRVRYGFVDCTSRELDRVLASPAGPYLRAAFVHGTHTEILRAIALLAEAPRPHLARLAIATNRRWAGSRARSAVLVDAALTAALVAATPALVALDLSGSRIFDAFPHPRVEEVRACGHDALGALVDAGPALPAARSLFFAFSTDPAGRITFGDQGLPRTLLAQATLPALVELDLSANELQRSWGNQHVALFELLAELGVLPQLARLRLPPPVEDAEREALAHARTLTRAAIEDTADRPQPLHDTIANDMFVLHLGARRDHTISQRRLGELMSAAWPALGDAGRAAWFALWGQLQAVDGARIDFWNEEEGGTEVPLTVFADALATLPDTLLDADHAIARLAAHVAHTAGSRLYVRRTYA